MTVFDAITEGVPKNWKNQKSELSRILDLPVLDVNMPIPDLTSMFRRPGGTMELRPIQSRALYMAMLYGGFVGPIGVGHGKGLISFLLPIVLKAKKPLLLIPASMRADSMSEWAKYAKHFYLPRNLKIMSYHALSNAKGTASLTQGGFDLVICDEGHKLKDQKATRTRRFLRYMNANPDTTFCVMSGTLESKSVKDYAHLARCALKENSPLPRDYSELENFAQALDPHIDGPNYPAQALLQPLMDKFGTSAVREAWRRRLESCPGVVITQERGIDAQIDIIARDLDITDTWKEHLDCLEDEWTLPNGDELGYVLDKNRAALSLSCGFYYEWCWPGGRKDEEWLEARRVWARALREYLPQSEEGGDSPMLAAVRCINAPLTVPGYLRQAWETWSPLKDKWVVGGNLPRETRWVSMAMIDDAVQWANEQKDPPLIWYTHDAVGALIAEQGNFELLGVGPEANRRLVSIKKPKILVLSANAHGTGKNLQDRWRNQLVTAPSSSGAVWEQLIGRTHRQGQEADLVSLTRYAHTDVFIRSFKRAHDRALALQEKNGSPMKLCYARHR